MNDEQVAALRAYLTGGHEEFVSLHRQLLRSDRLEGYGEFVYAAFVTAARRRFSPTYTRADIIRFVAGIRAVLSEMPDAINVHASETVIRRALGEQVTDEPDMEAKGQAQVVLLTALIMEEELDDAELDEFLDTARSLTGRWRADRRPISTD